jgi:hypothetical protein
VTCRQHLSPLIQVSHFTRPALAQSCTMAQWKPPDGFYGRPSGQGSVPATLATAFSVTNGDEDEIRSHFELSDNPSLTFDSLHRRDSSNIFQAGFQVPSIRGNRQCTPASVPQRELPVALIPEIVVGSPADTFESHNNAIIEEFSPAHQSLQMPHQVNEFSGIQVNESELRRLGRVEQERSSILSRHFSVQPGTSVYHGEGLVHPVAQHQPSMSGALPVHRMSHELQSIQPNSFPARQLPSDQGASPAYQPPSMLPNGFPVHQLAWIQGASPTHHQPSIQPSALMQGVSSAHCHQSMQSALSAQSSMQGAVSVSQQQPFMPEAVHVHQVPHHLPSMQPNVFPAHQLPSIQGAFPVHRVFHQPPSMEPNAFPLHQLTSMQSAPPAHHQPLIPGVFPALPSMSGTYPSHQVPHHPLSMPPNTLPAHQPSLTPGAPTAHHAQCYPESYDYHPQAMFYAPSRRYTQRDYPYLQKFTGLAPEEWPSWIAYYRATTAQYGIPPHENFERIKKAIVTDSPAHLAVRHLLHLPNEGETIIGVLQDFFGQPHFILQKLREKAEKFPQITDDRMDRLLALCADVENLVATMRTCAGEAHLVEGSLLNILVRKLPVPLQLQWGGSPYYGLQLTSFNNWLRSMRPSAIRIIDQPLSASAWKPTQPRDSTNRGINRLNVHESTEDAPERIDEESHSSEEPEIHAQGCKLCKSSDYHELKSCVVFCGKSVNERWETVRSLKVCFCCLNPGHGSDKCRDKGCEMDGCQRKHHELLHAVVRSHSGSHASSDGKNVLFKMFPVKLLGPRGEVEVLAFVDEGSDSTIISDALCERLGLKGTKSPFALEWSDGTTRLVPTSQKVTLSVRGVHKDATQFKLTGVRTVDVLNLPEQSLDVNKIQKRYKHLADVHASSYPLQRPQLLIGLPHYFTCIPKKSKSGAANTPLAVKMPLGWAVFGSLGGQQRAKVRVNYHHAKFFEVLPATSKVELVEPSKQRSNENEVTRTSQMSECLPKSLPHFKSKVKEVKDRKKTESSSTAQQSLNRMEQEKKHHGSIQKSNRKRCGRNKACDPDENVYKDRSEILATRLICGDKVPGLITGGSVTKSRKFRVKKEQILTSLI